MNTLSNIIPNPLSINKTLNANYSTSRFATSDYNGKSNTEVLSKYKDNIIPAKMPNNFYLGGIGEVGLVMENIDYINQLLTSYNGQKLSLDGQYASSTFYNSENVFNKQYELGGNLENIWYIDNNTGMISYSSIYDSFQSFPLYKYNIVDFDSTEDDYDGNTSNTVKTLDNQNFNLLNYFYFAQDDSLDTIENTLSFVFFNKENISNSKYTIINLNEYIYFTESDYLVGDPYIEYNPGNQLSLTFKYFENYLIFDNGVYEFPNNETLYVKDKKNNNFFNLIVQTINDGNNVYYYVFIYDYYLNTYFLLDTNNPNYVFSTNISGNEMNSDIFDGFYKINDYSIDNYISEIGYISNIYDYTTNEYIDLDVDFTDGKITKVHYYKENSLQYSQSLGIKDNEPLYVYNNSNEKYIKLHLYKSNTTQKNYLYCIIDNKNYIVYTDNNSITYDNENKFIDGGTTFYNINTINIDGIKNNGVFTNINIYKVKEETSNKTTNVFDISSIIKYPIYGYDNGGTYVYSIPLLPYKKTDNYYECEFFIILPEFSVNYNNGSPDVSYDLGSINSNIKISLKFGDGEIKELLSPYVRFKDAIVYKFKKSYLFDYMFIPNQELVISLIDSSKTSVKEKVLYSVKTFFNIFRFNAYQGKFQNIDCNIKYTNYYPLKYPLSSKKRFLELDYIPNSNVTQYSEKILLNTSINSDTSQLNIDKASTLISDFNTLAFNYSYLKTEIYHNLSESDDILSWFLNENGNGLRIGTGQSVNDNTYSMFTTYFSNQVNQTLNIENIDVYYKNFVNYDKDGILENNKSRSSYPNQLVKLLARESTQYNDKDEYSFGNKYDIPVFGMKELLYIPYKFNIEGVYNSQYVDFSSENGKISIFEDYLYIFNYTDDNVNLYFIDESLTLCEGTRTLHMAPNELRLYKPSRHKDYNIIIKNCKLNTYTLKLWKLYETNTAGENILNDSSKVNWIKQVLDQMEITTGYYNDYYAFIHLLINDERYFKKQDNPEILSIPIYDYKLPLFGNIVIIL